MMNLLAPFAAALLVAGSAPALSAPSGIQTVPAMAAPAATLLTSAEQASLLKTASEALMRVKSARGRFEQYAPDGSFSTGQFAIQRPGKVRFDYDDPVPLLMVSDGTTVALQDSELETTDRVPLASTPLSLLLSDRLDFESQADVLDVRQTGDITNITLQDKTGEMEGTLTLILSGQDLSLTGWRTVDANGGTTSVTLKEIETGAKLNPRLFILRDFDNN